MKKITYLIIAFFSLILINTILNVLAHEKQKIDFVKVEQVNIDKQEIEEIKKRTHVIITKIEKGEYYEFLKKDTGNDFGVKIDVTHQKEIQKQIKNDFGTFINLNFETLFKSKTENPFTNKIYLFKVDFASKKDVEIRIFLNYKKEIVGLNIMLWEKEYFNYL